MNTFLSSDQQALLARYKSYAKEHITPISSALDNGTHNVKDVFASLGQEGFLGLSVPKEYGGQGAPFLNFVLFVEAVAEAEPGLALSLAAHAQVIELLSKFGTDKQKSRYLPLLARGECIAALALTEEKAGSDWSAIQTSAESKNGKIVLSGKKTWVVNAGIASLAIIAAKVDGRVSLWLADLENNCGIKIGPNRKKLGLRSAVTNDIEIDSLEIAADAFLGAVDPVSATDDRVAHASIKHALDVSKVVVAAAAIGLLNHAVDESVGRARTREQFGANIGKYQAIQWKLADMSADSAAAQLLTYRAAWSKDNAEEDFHKFAAMSKIYATKTARVHSSEAVQIFGALGVSDDEPIEKMYRDAKVMEIAEGTSEIQKNIIAAEVR